MKFGQQKTELEVSEKEANKTETEEAKDLNSLAFSLTKHPEGGFALVTVKFNPVTMQAEVESVKKVSDSREEGEYYFRVEVGQYFADMELKS